MRGKIAFYVLMPLLVAFAAFWSYEAIINPSPDASQLNYNILRVLFFLALIGSAITGFALSKRSA